MPAVVSPATVLVTGVSGFIASHTAREYLASGFSVRGTVRSPEKGEYLRTLFDKEFPGKFEYVIADIMDAAAVDAAVRGVNGVAHVASPITQLPPGGDPQLLIRPAVEGTLNVLRSAAKAGTVERVVITGSIASIVEPHDAPYVYSARDWNEHSLKIVEELGGQAPPWDKYFASKVLAERAVYSWVEENKPNFDISHILPTWVYGPVLTPISSLEQVPDTPKLLWNRFAAPEEAMRYTNRAGDSPIPSHDVHKPSSFIHIRDVARAHVAAHTREALGHSSRLILVASSEVTYSDLYQTYWSLPEAERPRLPFEVPKSISLPSGDAEFRPPHGHKYENAEEALGWSFASLSDVVRDTLADLAPKIYDAYIH